MPRAAYSSALRDASGSLATSLQPTAASQNGSHVTANSNLLGQVPWLCRTEPHGQLRPGTTGQVMFYDGV